MGVGRSLQQLGQFLDKCEQKTAVSDVTFPTESAPSAGSLTASIELYFDCSDPDEADVGFEQDIHLADDGTLRIEFTSAPSILPAHDDIAVHPQDVSVTSDGGIEVTLAASVQSDRLGGEHEPDAARSDGTPDSDASVGTDDGSESVASQDDRDLPPFRDPDLLEEVYESCDRFVDMAEALDMDVTGETVRRYMIEHDIHDPASYNTADTEEERPEATEEVASATVLADGIGLPDGVTPDELVEAVKDGNTIYEVRRAIGIDREETITVLRELDLLDIVVGRIDTEAEREISREAVIERLRTHSANQ